MHYLGLCAAVLVIGQAAHAPHDPDLAFRIQAMAMADQEVRDRLVRQMRSGKQPPLNLVHELTRVDRENTAAMKAIVDTYGWPTVRLVGKPAASDAWLLVQHADLDPDFQERCLKLMEPLVARGEASGKNYAYLFDRVACARGRKQRYGTQFEQKNGKWSPKPIEDPRNVDIRRKKMGMMPLAEYARLLREAYGGAK